jgi:hypothetical protein
MQTNLIDWISSSVNVVGSGDVPLPISKRTCEMAFVTDKKSYSSAEAKYWPFLPSASPGGSDAEMTALKICKNKSAAEHDRNLSTDVELDGRKKQYTVVDMDISPDIFAFSYHPSLPSRHAGTD